LATYKGLESVKNWDRITTLSNTNDHLRCQLKEIIHILDDKIATGEAVASRYGKLRANAAFLIANDLPVVPADDLAGLPSHFTAMAHTTTADAKLNGAAHANANGSAAAAGAVGSDKPNGGLPSAVTRPSVTAHGLGNGSANGMGSGAGAGAGDSAAVVAAERALSKMEKSFKNAMRENVKLKGQLEAAHGGRILELENALTAKEREFKATAAELRLLQTLNKAKETKERHMKADLASVLRQSSNEQEMLQKKDAEIKTFKVRVPNACDCWCRCRVLVLRDARHGLVPSHKRLARCVALLSR
jgi:hypothetical protein